MVHAGLLTALLVLVFVGIALLALLWLGPGRSEFP
jgi:hypothetical protein